MPRIRLRQCNVPLANLPSPLDGLRILHLADLHMHRPRPLFDRLQQLLIRLDYDLLAFTGDFTHHPHRWQRGAEHLMRFFEPVQPPLGIYLTLGNHDHRRLAEPATPPNVRFLLDERTCITVGDQRLQIAGLDQSYGRRGSLAPILDTREPDAPLILLAHYPSTMNRYPPGTIDLQLSGHTHGGQIRIPGVGCLWNNDAVPLALSDGLHHLPHTTLHISRGIGTSPYFPVRIFCPPELTILTLRPAATDHAVIDPSDHARHTAMSPATPV